MNLPQFLIIGAMKSGTTTLYDDLRRHPSVFFPIDKEPDFFSLPHSTSPEAVAQYAKLFAKAGPSQLIAEASTSYTKRPTYEGVAERARAVLGEKLKVIYIVRDPIRRCISHHHHMHVSGYIGPDINRTVYEHDEILAYSKYAYQIEPWIEALGRENVLILKFEDYMGQREAGYGQVCDWLGLERNPLNQPDRHRNASSGKPLPTGHWRKVIQSRLYRKLLRPFLPISFKSWLIHSLLPKASVRLDPPHAETLEHMVLSLKDQTQRISSIMGHQQPIWDLDQHLHDSAQQLTEHTAQG